MSMIHIAIVEDEMNYVRTLEDYIQRYRQEKQEEIRVSIFADGEDIMENYDGQFDIILMDIQMRFMDGMTAAEKIRDLDREVVILFITNMIQYAVKGYEVDAMDYVLKPVEYFAFSQKLDKAIGRISRNTQKYIAIPTTDGMKKVAVSDIYYIESLGQCRISDHKRCAFFKGSDEGAGRNHGSLWIFPVWERVSGQYEICGRNIRKQLHHCRRKDSNQPDEEKRIYGTVDETYGRGVSDGILSGYT